MVNFTLDDLMEFTQKEEKLLRDIFPIQNTNCIEPSEKTMSSIIAYSKAISIRKSKKMNHFKMLLN